MDLHSQIELIRKSLRDGRFTSEAAVSQGIVLPVLQGLGWPVFDPAQVIPEYSVQGRRVDFALCNLIGDPQVFVEVKKVGSAYSGEQQLFEYAFHLGVPLAVLTDGQEWNFYVPGERGNYTERRVYKLDMLERDAAVAIDRLTRYLEHDRVVSGEAIEAAKSDYADASRSRMVRSTIPKAWAAMIDEPDPAIVDMLAERVEDLCGFRPEPDAITEFLLKSPVRSSVATVGQPPESAARGSFKAEVVSTAKPAGFAFAYGADRRSFRSAKALLIGLFELLIEADPAFIERLDARKHGRKRRYVARTRDELYPGREDLSADFSHQLSNGWWLGTNYSHRTIRRIVDLAIEVADSKVASRLEIEGL